MRTLITIIIILVVLLGSSIFMSNFIVTSSNEMEQEMNVINKRVMERNWKEAQAQLTVIDNKWNDTKDKWAMLIDHQEIDNINLSMSKMKEYIKVSDSTQALAEISSLKVLFQHVPEREEVAFKNIF